MERDIAVAFCDECDSLYHAWLTCRIVFDRLPGDAGLSDAAALDTPVGNCIDRVHGLCLNAWIMQLMRLSDPAEQRGNRNLSIALIRESDGWTDDERVRVDQLAEELHGLAERLGPARDKIIAHNDLRTRRADAALGGFPEGEDEAYFHALAELVTMVWEKWCHADAEPNLRNRVFDFDLNALADDELSPRYQAQALRDCLSGALREYAARGN
ncbi:MAG: hypothetical protein OXQ29_00440 [Rhodospirillaceae bacterium]|nr:hypothetical protein [Rhodospirillaceae bacterium]